MSAIALAGGVLTMADGRRKRAEALAFEGDRITYVGDVEGAQASASNGGGVVSMGDRTIMPGFIDAHAHVEIGGRALASMADCRAPRCRTVDDVLQALRDGMHLKDRTGGWLQGQANLFLDQKLEDKRFPTSADLDKVSKKVPIVLRAGGHRSVLNTVAFEKAGLDARRDGETGLMGKAVIETDEHGCRTGVVAEIDKSLPIPDMEEGELREALADGVKELFTRYGVTTVGEITESKLGVSALDWLAGERRLGARISAYLWAPGTFTLEEACDYRNHTDFTAPEELFQVRGVKLFADGGYSARNAATRKPYLSRYAVRPGSRGRVNLDRRQVAAALRQINDAGLQLAVHANGERAQDVVCEGVLLAGGPRDDAPATRIEHAGNLQTEPKATELWRQAGIIPMPQAVFLYNFGDFLAVYLGKHGAHGRFPFRRLIDEGWRLNTSSDLHLGAEEEQTNPLFGVWCATERTSFLGDVLEREQAVTVDEGLAMYTRHAAEALGVEKERGTLEKGKLADVIVFDRDLTGVSGDELRKVQVDFVFLGGELVYRRPGARPPEGAKLPRARQVAAKA
jgi:predicted amidohydrolase YtcJ